MVLFFSFHPFISHLLIKFPSFVLELKFWLSLFPFLWSWLESHKSSVKLISELSYSNKTLFRLISIISLIDLRESFLIFDWFLVYCVSKMILFNIWKLPTQLIIMYSFDEHPLIFLSLSIILGYIINSTLIRFKTEFWFDKETWILLSSQYCY